MASWRSTRWSNTTRPLVWSLLRAGGDREVLRLDRVAGRADDHGSLCPERRHGDAAWNGVQGGQLDADLARVHGERSVQAELRERDPPRRRVAEREIDAAVVDRDPVEAQRRQGGLALARGWAGSDEAPAVGRGEGTDADVTQPDRADLDATGEQRLQRVGRRQLPRVDARAAGELEEDVVRPEAGDQGAAHATDRDARIGRLDEDGSDPLAELALPDRRSHGDDEDDQEKPDQEENAGDHAHEASDESERRHVRRCLPPPGTPATRSRRPVC